MSRRERLICKFCREPFQRINNRPNQIFCNAACQRDWQSRERKRREYRLLDIVKNQPIDPDHYKKLDPEPITVIDSWKLNFNLGSALSYIARAEHKGTRRADLIKAANYLFREATGKWLPKEILDDSGKVESEVPRQSEGSTSGPKKDMPFSSDKSNI